MSNITRLKNESKTKIHQRLDRYRSIRLDELLAIFHHLPNRSMNVDKKHSSLTIIADCPWLFVVWRLILLVLLMSKGDAKYAIIAFDYFSKWADVESLATITTKKVINFVVRNTICRFGGPQMIISDNGTQCDNIEFNDFYRRRCIEKRLAVVAHRQANGHAEAVNKII